jgi:branched-chain amino acid transport system substrate-binding protein
MNKMKQKLIGVGAAVLVLALLLTLAPSCGEKGGVKTLKVGLVMPLSGVGAPWGLESERGVQWAIDKVNAEGGFRVGDDTYMIELVKCDTKLTGSAAADCASKFVHDEKIHYAVGPMVTSLAMSPILTRGKCFTASPVNATPFQITPDLPYNLANAAPIPQWVDAFWKQAYRFHPEIETVTIVSGTDLAGELYSAASEAVHAGYGREVIDVARYQPFSQDYYPILTPIVAKNPDVIDFAGGMKGDIDLMVKQVRELGYTGLLSGSSHGDTTSTIEVAGAEATEGFMVNDPDYGSDLYPESTQQLYAEYQQRYGDQPLSAVTYGSYAGLMLLVQAIEEAESIDPDEVMKVFDDPNWEFEWFGIPGRSLGGLETFGIRRCVQDEVGYSEVINGVKVMKSHERTMIP